MQYLERIRLDRKLRDYRVGIGPVYRDPRVCHSNGETMTWLCGSARNTVSNLQLTVGCLRSLHHAVTAWGTDRPIFSFALHFNPRPTRQQMYVLFDVARRSGGITGNAAPRHIAY